MFKKVKAAEERFRERVRAVAAESCARQGTLRRELEELHGWLRIVLHRLEPGCEWAGTALSELAVPEDASPVGDLPDTPEGLGKELNASADRIDRIVLNLANSLGTSFGAAVGLSGFLLEPDGSVTKASDGSAR